MRLMWIALLCLLATSAAHAGSIHVDPVGDDVAGTGSATEPFRSMQRALEASAPDDSILVHPGLYTGIQNHNLRVEHPVTILGTASAGDVVFDTELETFVQAFPVGSGRFEVSAISIRNARQYAIRGSAGEVVLRNLVFEDCQGDGFAGQPRICELSARTLRIEQCRLIDSAYVFSVQADSTWVRDVVVDNSPGPQSTDSIRGSDYLQIDRLELLDYACGLWLSGNHVVADSVRLVQRVQPWPGGVYLSGTGTGPTARVSHLELDYSSVASNGPARARLLWFTTWSDLQVDGAIVRPPVGGPGTMAVSLERVADGLLSDLRVVGGRSTADPWTPIAVQASQSNVVLQRTLVADHGSADRPYLGIFVHTSSLELVQSTVADVRGAQAISLYDGQLSLDRVLLSNEQCGVAVACGSTSSATATATDVFGHADGNWTGCLEGLDGQDGNFSADPLFCAGGQDGYAIAANSPCAEGNHPSGVDWGLIGFADVGCASVPARGSTMGAFKGRFRGHR